MGSDTKEIYQRKHLEEKWKGSQRPWRESSGQHAHLTAVQKRGKKKKAWQGDSYTAAQFLEGFDQVDRESSCQSCMSEEGHISWGWISIRAFLSLVCSVICWAQVSEGQSRHKHGGGFRAQELGISVNYASHSRRSRWHIFMASRKAEDYFLRIYI